DTNLLGIDREGERQANESAAELGIAPPVAAMLTNPPALVTEFVDGKEMTEEDLRKPEVVERIAPELRQMHDSATKLPTDFVTVSIAEEYARIARERGVEVPSAYDEAMGFARKIQA